MPRTRKASANVGYEFSRLIESLGVQFGGSWRHANPRTLRRTFLNRPGTLRETPGALLVELDWFPEQEVVRPLVGALSAAQVQLRGPGGTPPPPLPGAGRCTAIWC